MMAIKPYEHQKEVINEVITKLKSHKSVLLQASTGFGKTIVSAFLIKYYIEKGLRILFLADGEELIKQSSSKLSLLGIPHENIFAKTRKPKHHSNCYVAMIETINNRLEKDRHFLRNIDLIISDEAHVLVHEKVYIYYPKAKVIALTATPIVLKRVTFYKCEVCKTQYNDLTECCGSEVMEYSRPFSMSEIYETIVVSKGIDWLIENDYLVQDITIVKNSVNLDKLEKDKSGEFTNASQNKVFTDENSIEKLVDDYINFYKGKKTILFTPSTKVNKLIVNKFVERGIDAKSFDSVNNKQSERKDTLDWFENKRDTVLVNTGCFVKGLDITDIEVIITYLSTESLSKYIQMVGRAARTTKKIFKNNFYFVDYGGNVDKHQQFSDPTRDWEHIFYNGIGDTKAKKEALESVTQCDNCGCIYPSNLGACTNCKEEPKPKKKMVKVGEDYVLEPITPMPPPSGKRIVEYAKSRNEGAAFAFRIMMNLILDLFKFYNVEKIIYIRSKETGELDRKLNKIIQKCYFTIINSGLPGANRRLKTIIEKTKQKLDDYYDGRT